MRENPITATSPPTPGPDMGARPHGAGLARPSRAGGSGGSITEDAIMDHCTHCDAYGILTPATHRGIWIDATGERTEETTILCLECATAGRASGPGYTDVEPLDAEEVTS